jgi:hypothetical protein
VLFFSDNYFQQPRSYVGQLQSILSRVRFRLFDNQPCLLQNTTLFRQPRLYIGSLLALCSTLHYLLQRLFPSIVVVGHPPQRQTAVFAVAISDTLLSFTHYSSLVTHHFLSLAAAIPLNCCCATPRRSNYACLLRQNLLFCPFAAVVKSTFLPPTVWRDWQKSATKRPFPPKNRHIFPVLSPLQTISATPLPPQQKANLPTNRFLLITRYSLLLLFCSLATRPARSQYRGSDTYKMRGQGAYAIPRIR